MAESSWASNCDTLHPPSPHITWDHIAARMPPICRRPGAIMSSVVHVLIAKCKLERCKTMQNNAAPKLTTNCLWPSSNWFSTMTFHTVPTQKMKKPWWLMPPYLLGRGRGVEHADLQQPKWKIAPRGHYKTSWFSIIERANIHTVFNNIAIWCYLYIASLKRVLYHHPIT